MIDYIKKNWQWFLISLIGILLIPAFLFSRESLPSVERIFERNDESNFYEQIKALKEKNSNLQQEVEELSFNLEKLSDQNKALEVIRSELEKYKKISGENPVFGPGIVLLVDKPLSTPWVVDIINEMFRYGAQAIAINSIRITNQTMGIQSLPRGQMLMNGVLLKSPLRFEVIGEADTLIEVLEGPEGIFEKLEATYPGVKIELTRKEVIKI